MCRYGSCNNRRSRQLFLICRYCDLGSRYRIRRGGKSRYVYCGQPESPASFLIETGRPNKSGTAVNAVDRQALLRRAGKIAEVINQKSFSGVLSICQDVDALLVQRLQRNFTPNRDESIWKATSMWHLQYACRFTKITRILLYVEFGFAWIKKCRLLRTIDV